MKLSVLSLICACAAAQSLPPNMPQLPPGMTLPPGVTMPTGRGKRPAKRNDASRPMPPGVPIPLDSAPMKAFQLLEQHPVYHMRMALSAADPQMTQMLAQMGFAPMETTVSGGAKQVVMRMKMPATDVPGQVDDWEFRSVSKDGRAARLITSSGQERFLARTDAHLDKEMVEVEKMAARTIAQSLAQGPVGWARAAMAGAEAGMAAAELGKMRKTAHDFFKWQCITPPNRQPADHTAPPPLTDLQAAGEQTLDGVAVTTYEFYVHEKDQFYGPMRMHVAKDTGLPMRIEMADPQMRGGSMQMDYYDFDKGGDIEIPACLAGGK
jgi:hypothetical protein